MSKFSLTCVARAALAWCALAVLLAGVRPTPASAAEYRSISDFRAVGAAVARYVERFGPEHVLLVVDIDNTTLAMNHALGSDQWFEWQDYLLKHEPDSPYLVADSFEGLLEVQGVLYNLGRMHPPQPDLPQIIRRIQSRGVAAVVLTSRGEEFRVATERELTRNGYDFARSALPVHNPNGDPYLPYKLDRLAEDGIKVTEAAAFDLKPPRPVSYYNGIMMTAGQHKGAMLLTLLARSDRDVQAVVYVDDHERHVARVFVALSGRGIEATTFHYHREDENVKSFQYGDKGDVTRRWHRLRDTLQAVFE